MLPVPVRRPVPAEESAMNRPTASVFAPGPLALSGLIVLAALSRLLPHPPNFSPVEAIALFGGAYFASRQWALVVPLLAMLLSDLALGALHGDSYASYLGGISFWSVYACIALSFSEPAWAWSAAGTSADSVGRQASRRTTSDAKSWAVGCGSSTVANSSGASKLFKTIDEAFRSPR